MEISVQFDKKEVDKLIEVFPEAAEQAIGTMVKKIGLQLKREATKEAPAITGNLRRSIRFIHSSQTAGVLKAFANYSKYVHGEPFYTNRIKRRETPFFTAAEQNSRQFIATIGNNLRADIIRNIR